MTAGWSWREEQQNERAAWVVAHLLNISGKSLRTRVTPKRLLYRQAPARDQDSWWDRVEKRRREKREKRDGLTEGG